MKIIDSWRIAIFTKRIPPSSTKGSRVKAYTDNGHSVTLNVDDSLSAQENHNKAALALVEKMNWDKPEGTLLSGGTRNGHVYLFF